MASKANSCLLAARGAWACIKPMPNRKRVPAFSPFPYRYRNLVECFFRKLKHFRASGTRYDKRDDNFLASVELASIRIWMRHNESITWWVSEWPSHVRDPVAPLDPASAMAQS